MNIIRLKSLVREWGCAYLFYAFLMQRLKSLITFCAVYTTALPSPDKNATCDGASPNRSLRMASDEDLRRASQDASLELNGAWLQKARARGDICVALFDGECMLSYVWATRAPNPHQDGIWVHFDPAQIYAYKAFTVRAGRRKGLQDLVRTRMLTLLYSHGYREAVGFVETHNLASMGGLRKAGIEASGYAGYLTLFGRVIPFRSAGARRIGFGFSVCDAPVEEGLDLATTLH